MPFSANRKHEHGFHFIEILLVVAILAVAGFVAFMFFSKAGHVEAGHGRSGPNYNALAACNDKPPLNTLPADLSRLEQIAPMGGLNPPDHTLPTDHMYMVYPYEDKSQKGVYAPADIVVTGVSFGTEYMDGKLVTSDYALSFYPCRELKLIYGHIDVLPAELSAAVGKDFENGTGCRSSKQGPNEVKHCEKEVDIKLSAGEKLGTTNGWDLWATYEGRVSQQVVSPNYYHNVDAVCPLDYFTSDLKSQLYALVRRTHQPKCGEAYQDKADTLQGGWFAHEDPVKAKTDWPSQLALVHHPADNAGMVVVGGTIADGDFMYRFDPKQTGTINREFSQTRAGTMYCYQHEGEQRMSNGYMAGMGKLLVKLADNHTMQVERQDGACSANETFMNPTNYYR